MEKAVKITLIISVVVLLIVFGGITYVKSIFAPTSNTVSATGESKINVMPDVTRVYFFVETKEKSAEIAKNSNNIIYNRITSALLTAGTDEKDITTEQFSVNENFEWNGTANNRIGFIAQHYAKVNLKDIDEAGKVIDAIVDNSGRINYINFELSQEKQNSYKTDALKLASEDARRKAGAIANGLGKNLGSLVSVQTDEFNYNPWPIYASRDSGIIEKAAVKEAVSDINPSEKEVTARVVVVYRIK